MGIIPKAEQIFTKSVTLRKEKDGEKSESYAIGCNNLGILYLRQKQPEKALKYFNTAMNIYKSIKGNKSSNYLLAKNNYTNALVRTHNYVESEKNYIELLQEYNEFYGSEYHFDIALVYSNYASLLYRLKKYDKALKYNQKSLQIYQKVMGEKFTEYIIATINTIDMLLKLKKYQMPKIYLNSV